MKYYKYPTRVLTKQSIFLVNLVKTLLSFIFSTEIFPYKYIDSVNISLLITNNEELKQEKLVPTWGEYNRWWSCRALCMS